MISAWRQYSLLSDPRIHKDQTCSCGTRQTHHNEARKSRSRPRGEPRSGDSGLPPIRPTSPHLVPGCCSMPRNSAASAPAQLQPYFNQNATMDSTAQMSGHTCHCNVSLTTGNGVEICAASAKPIQYVPGLWQPAQNGSCPKEGQGIGDLVRVRLLSDDAFGLRVTESFSHHGHRKWRGETRCRPPLGHRSANLRDEDSGYPERQRSGDYAGRIDRLSISRRLISQPENTKKQCYQPPRSIRS